MRYENNDIVNFNVFENRVFKNGKYRSYNIFRAFRSNATIAANKETRTQFLAALANSLGFGGDVIKNENTGKITFSADLLPHLRDALGERVCNQILKPGILPLTTKAKSPPESP